MPTTEPLSRDVERKISEIFSDAHDAQLVREILSAYGAEWYRREQNRVRLGILKLCGWTIAGVRHEVEVAKKDYRDVLAYAEYPEQMKSKDPGAPERDRAQYLDWLNGSSPI